MAELVNVEIGGRNGLAAYFDARWRMVPPTKASFAKVVFDDGGIAFYRMVEDPAPRAAEFREEDHPRGRGGRFVHKGQVEPAQSNLTPMPKAAPEPTVHIDDHSKLVPPGERFDWADVTTGSAYPQRRFVFDPRSRKLVIGQDDVSEEDMGEWHASLSEKFGIDQSTSLRGYLGRNGISVYGDVKSGYGDGLPGGKDDPQVAVDDAGLAFLGRVADAGAPPDLPVFGLFGDPMVPGGVFNNHPPPERTIGDILPDRYPGWQRKRAADAGDLRAAAARARAAKFAAYEAGLLRDAGGPGSGNFGHAGRPGEIGGSAPADTSLSDRKQRAEKLRVSRAACVKSLGQQYPPAIQPAVTKAAEALYHESFELGPPDHEALVLLDPDTGKRRSTVIAGDDTGVDVPPGLVQDDAIVAHTHPAQDAPFSAQDIATALKSRVREAAVLTQEGGWYRATFDHSRPEDEKRDFVVSASLMIRDAQRQAQADVDEVVRATMPEFVKSNGHIDRAAVVAARGPKTINDLFVRKFHDNVHVGWMRLAKESNGLMTYRFHRALV